MSTALAERPAVGDIMEAVIARGDLAKLTPQERSTYYMRVCESVGLNPMTRPFEYITLNGKLTLYARKDCTDQLRRIHHVSVTDLCESEREGVFIVTAKVQDESGRSDVAKGAVSIANLKGDALANALMKAETKAKRRATLSICGLGFLDETEIEDIPNAQAHEEKPEAKQDPRFISRDTWKALAHSMDAAGLDGRKILERYGVSRPSQLTADKVPEIEQWIKDRPAWLMADPPPAARITTAQKETIDEIGQQLRFTYKQYEAVLLELFGPGVDVHALTEEQAEQFIGALKAKLPAEQPEEEPAEVV